MQPSSKISAYLKSVCDQIRWKKAHGVIAKEMEDHLLDQVNAFKACGLDEETATEQAIKEMGDPVMVGSQFDRTYKPKIEWSILAMTGILLLIGLTVRILVNNTGSTLIPGQDYLLVKHIINAMMGIVCMLLAYFLDFTIIGKYPKILFFGLIALAVVVIIFSPSVYGQKYYAKFLMLLFPTAFAGIIYCMRTKAYLGILLSGVFFAVPWIIGFIIPSVSGAISYALACLILLTYAIWKGWFEVRKFSALLLVYCPTVAITVVTVLAGFMTQPYRMQRLQIVLNPSLDPTGAGYMASMTRNILSHARFIGQGKPGEMTGFILPNIDTDLILTYLIHRLGWIAFIAVMAVFTAFIVRAFILCFKQKSILGKLVSLSVLITFTMEAALYVASNLGFQLFSALSLPLISYGGAATITNMFLIGIMLSVFKSDHLVQNSLTSSGKIKNKLFEIADGKIIIYFK